MVNMKKVSFDKILNRIKLLCIGEEFKYKLNIDPTIIAQKVCSQMYDNVKTSELDKLSSEISIALYTTHPDYAAILLVVFVYLIIKRVVQIHFQNVLIFYIIMVINLLLINIYII